MFFYSCSWVISILEACRKIPHVLFKSDFRGIVLRSLYSFSFDEAFCDAWWVTRIQIRVLECFCRLEVRSNVKDRILVESDTFVPFVSKNVVSVSDISAVCEFDCRMEVVYL